MGPSIEGNGLELWRRLFRDYMGSDAHTRLAGQSQFLDFPACNDLKTLSSHLDSWYNMMETYGTGVDDERRRVLLLKIIPSDMRSDMLKSDELKRKSKSRYSHSRESLSGGVQSGQFLSMLESLFEKEWNNAGCIFRRPDGLFRPLASNILTMIE